jgi:RHS repeat-associated protein
MNRLGDNKAAFPMYSLAGQLVTEEDNRSDQATDYVYLNGSLVAKRSRPVASGAWTTTYLHTDALGTPVAETNALAQLQRTRDLTPYGVNSATFVGEPLVQGPEFTGHVTDAATGLVYMQQRYYDPALGRFLAVDPLPSNTGSGSNFNRYWYGNNNPYKFVDPDGREVRRFQCVWATIGCGSEPPWQEAERVAPVQDTTVPRRGSPRGYADGRFSMEGRYRRYSNGKPKRHTGTDMLGPPGTKVGSSASGKVVLDGYVKGFGGKTIIVETQSTDGNTYQVLYGHLESNSVDLGDYVNRGQAIGIVGEDGSARGVPHLHMDVAIGQWAKDAPRVDPEQWIKFSPISTTDADYSKP